MIGLAAILFVVLLPDAPPDTAPVEDLSLSISRARELAYSRRFDEAVALYEDVLRKAPDLWDAALGRAQALAWGGRYAQAESAFRALLIARPDSLPALRGRAQTVYWSGDFREALKLFVRLHDRAPEDVEAREAIANLEALMRAVATLGLEGAHDDQPADRVTVSSKVAWGVDPLTTAAAELTGLELEADGAGGRVRIGDARIGIAARFPRGSINISGRIGLRRFSDGATAPLMDLNLERPFSAGALTASLVRDTALDSAPSYRSHQSVESVALGFRRDDLAARPRLNGAVSLRVLRFGDGNAALSASAWASLPLGQLGPLRLAGTVATSYRDSRQDRVRAVFEGATPLPAGGFSYEISTQFDPYVTPARQLEARLGVQAVLRATPRLNLTFIAEAGTGRERATGFGPSTGPTAAAPALAPGTFVRSYTPFRSVLSGTFVAGSSTLRAEVERASSAFYVVTTVNFLVTRRF